MKTEIKTNRQIQADAESNTLVKSTRKTTKTISFLCIFLYKRQKFLRMNYNILGVKWNVTGRAKKNKLT